MSYQSVPLDKAYLLLNHGPTIMITSAAQGKYNIMSAAWSTALDFAPPKLIIVVDKQSYTQELINDSGEFTVLIPGKNMAKQVLQIGGCSGRDIDKFDQFNLETLPASTVQAPLIKGCLGGLECKLIREPHNQTTYDLYIGEVTAAWADPDVFSEGRWHIKQDDKRSLHYQAGGEFFAIGESFHVD